MMDSATFTGRVREIVRKMLKPAVYEARVASAPDMAGRVYVTSRPLTGTAHRLGPFQAGHLHRHDGEDVIGVAVGDRVWLAVDEGNAPACLVGWGG
jgi:hypothetical protein